MNKPAIWTAALMLLLVSTGATAHPNKHDSLIWLQAMVFAANQTDYAGTFVYQYGNHVEVSRITHITNSTGVHSRLERLDGPQRTFIRNNDEVWCYLGDRKVRVELRQGRREFPALLPEQLNLLSENYRVKEAENTRVAGYPAHGIMFHPRDNLRYAHKMWAHEDTGLLLKAAVLDERGSLIEQHTFTQLEIGGNIDDRWLLDEAPPVASNPAVPPQNSGGAPRSVDQSGLNDLANVSSGWLVDVPPGFKKIAEVRRVLPGKDAPVIQLVYSDGLAGISIFIEKAAAKDENREGLSSQGIIQAYSRMVDNQRITVIGEVPPRTVMQIANSVRKGGARQP